MAALFIDLDGTCVGFHTNTWLPGVFDKLCRLQSQGHQLVFITMRGPQDENTEWCVENTYKLLDQLPFKNFQLLTNIQSPRVLIDDSPAYVFKAETNEPTWLKQVP